MFNSSFRFTLPKFNFRSLFVLPYIILLITGLTVPSDGAHGLLSLKSLSFIACTLSILSYLFIYQRLNWNQLKLFLFLCLTITFLLLWTLIALYGEGIALGSAVDQFKLFLITICVIVMSLYISEENLLSFSNFLKIIVYANFFYSFLKLVMVLFYLLGFVNLDDFLSLLGIRYMTMAIHGDMTRLQTSVDIITPFLIFFVLQADRLNVRFSKTFKRCFIIVSLFSIFFSFSRFLLGVATLSFLLYGLSLNIAKAMRWFAVGVILMSAAVAWIGMDTVFSVVEMRFFSLVNADSDSVRGRQIDALLKEFEKFPVFGKGLGGYSDEVIRDTVNYHSYEVQWIAFLMQFGMIGLLLLIIPLAWIGWQLLSSSFLRLNIGFFVLYLMWLISGFFNPFLISLTSGIVYSLFALTGLKMQNSIAAGFFHHRGTESTEKRQGQEGFTSSVH